jgi:hypothetical protein
MSTSTAFNTLQSAGANVAFRGVAIVPGARVPNTHPGLQVDFRPQIHGVRSFQGLRSRSAVRDLDGLPLRVATLDDMIASKKAAGAIAARPCFDHEGAGQIEGDLSATGPGGPREPGRPNPS